MFKFIGKLLFIIMGLFLLAQIPFFKVYVQEIKTVFYEKVDNVVAEYNRLTGKYEEVKEKAVEAKETVIEVTDKVKETAEAVEGAITAGKKVTEDVNAALKGTVKPEEVSPPASPEAK